MVLEIANIWPKAPIYTSLYRPDSTFPEFRRHEIRRTFLDALPVDRGYRNLFPLYAPAFLALPPIDADLVIASSSGWGHLARARPDAFHVVYCHTPARWLYRDQLVAGRLKHAGARALIKPLKLLDQQAARRAHLYIANSRNIQRSIREVYGVESIVVHPPVDVDRFVPSPRGSRLLVVSRLLPYKHVDCIIAAANVAGIGLDIVGDGPLLDDLRAMSSPCVTFHGAAPDDVLVSLMQDCLAVCIPAEEDFGIVSVEAQAAGKPVVAYAGGGSLETVVEGVTGTFFRDRRHETIIAAISASDRIPTGPYDVAAHARNFSTEAFRKGLLEATLRSMARI